MQTIITKLALMGSISTLLFACGVGAVKEDKRQGHQENEVVVDESSRTEFEQSHVMLGDQAPDYELPEGMSPVSEDTTKPSAQLLAHEHPGWNQTCAIHLNLDKGGGDLVWCRGAWIKNWFLDNDYGALVNSARCAQRAADWYNWCQFPRRTGATVLLKNVIDGSVIVARNGSGMGLGSIFAPSGHSYYVPN